ncbi:hypothetical protein ACTQ6A_09170 [Lachnospiraceae bacterium LCP25S3_G4]
MEHGRKKLRVCLICVVFLAIVVGLFYYYYDVQQSEMTGEGTLVEWTGMETYDRWPL